MLYNTVGMLIVELSIHVILTNWELHLNEAAKTFMVL